jgi:hypothetical protein
LILFEGLNLILNSFKMPASIKSVRNSIKGKLNKNDNSSKKKPTIEYNHTDSEGNEDERSINDTIGSFSDAQSIKSRENSDQESEFFIFKKLNHQGSLMQIKGAAGEDDTKSVTSRASKSKVILRKKEKDEIDNVSRGKKENKTLDKKANEKNDERKSLSSFRDSIKSKLSMGRKDSPKAPKEQANEDKSSSSSSKAKTDEAKSTKDLLKSIRTKEKRDEDENKSIASSKKSILIKNTQSKRNEVTKKDEDVSVETNDGFLFQKIGQDYEITSKVFEVMLRDDKIIKVYISEPEIENKNSNSIFKDIATDNNQSKLILLVKKDTQVKYPYSIETPLKQIAPSTSSNKPAEPVVLIKNIEPSQSEDLSSIEMKPVVLIQNKIESPSVNIGKKDLNFKGMIETQDQYGIRESREITDEELESYKEILRLANGVADF